jgi:hypothetical protein
MARQLLDREPVTDDPRRLSRRAAWLLIALCGWTLYVWITRIWIIAGQHNSAGFVAVHVTLGIISIAFGLAAGFIGFRRLRADRGI